MRVLTFDPRMAGGDRKEEIRFASRASGSCDGPAGGQGRLGGGHCRGTEAGTEGAGEAGWARPGGPGSVETGGGVAWTPRA